MKTPMQEFIEVLKTHRDTAFEKAEHFKSHDTEGLYKWYDFRGQTFEDAISFAEAHLEKEKRHLESSYEEGYDECNTGKLFRTEWYNETFNTENE